MEIVFLTRSTCRNSPVVEERLLGAIQAVGFETTLKTIDVGSLPSSDYRTGYGTPTILVGGEDLFGAPRPKPASPI